MSASGENNRRIAVNTVMLYVRMIVMMVVGFITVPIVLRNLGVSDYGLYNVIGGVVAMFSFVRNSLASGTQRYIAYALGRDDRQLLDDTFHTTLSIFSAFGLAALVLVEAVGLWFVNTKMSIPADRLAAANYVFHLSVLSFVVGILSIPYDSAVIAHEKMGVYAYVNIFDCVAKLLIALSLAYAPCDRLYFYATLQFVLAVSLRVFYQVYCRRQFVECRLFRLKWESSLGKRLLRYSTWNMVGALALLGRNQGLNVIMNMFFGTVLNAAHAIANQVNTVVGGFVTSVYTASRPRITKLYAEGDGEGMWDLVFRSAKFAFFLLTFLSVPAIIELRTLLGWWLGTVPRYTVPIATLLLAVTLIETLTNQLVAAFQAADRIKHYQQYSSTIILMCLPLSYIVLRCWTDNPLAPYTISAALSLLFVVVITCVARRDIGLDVPLFIRRVIVPNVLVFSAAFLITWRVARLMEPSMARVCVTVAVSLAVSSSAIWLVGFDKKERAFIKEFVKTRIRKV